MASATGIFDIRKCEWDGELVRYLNLKPENFPPVARTDSETFCLKRKIRKTLAAAERCAMVPCDRRRRGEQHRGGLRSEK
jgi:sugar (pentulose or hexulose) kinase